MLIRSRRPRSPCAKQSLWYAPGHATPYFVAPYVNDEVEMIKAFTNLSGRLLWYNEVLRLNDSNFWALNQPLNFIIDGGCVNWRNNVLRVWGYPRELWKESKGKKALSSSSKVVKGRAKKKVAPISLDRSASKALEPSLHSRLGGFECRFAAVKKVRRNWFIGSPIRAQTRQMGTTEYFGQFWRGIWKLMRWSLNGHQNFK